MKISIDLERELVDIARRKIGDYYYQALENARREAERDMDKISEDIIAMVKEEVKLIKLK